MRFIPSAETVIKAAEELPDAAIWKSETYQVKIDSTRAIDFRRIKFKDSSGRGYRWIYDGKILVK